VDGDALKSVIVRGPAHGSVALNANGSFTYAPAANFNGSDSFTYKANDGSLDSNVATVSITVRPVNDAPVARDDDYSTPQGVSLNVNAPGVLANDGDVDGDKLSAAVVSGPAHGMLSLNADGSFTYNPSSGYTGTDSFTYRAGDGALSSNVATVVLHVTPTASTAGTITGAGSLDRGQRLFALDVEARERRGDLVISGAIVFLDRQNRIAFESTQISSLRIDADGIHGMITGVGKVNGRSGYSFTVLVEDHGGPGHGGDKFRILLSGPGGFAYDSLDWASAAGVIEAGNVKVRRKG